jgi:hypothetical protein
MKNSLCKHKRRRNSCKECRGSQICVHNRLRSSCIPCKGGGVCAHEKQRSVCRSCNVLGWAKKIVRVSKQNAKRFGYTAPNTTAEKIVEMVALSLVCCGCGALLNWNKESPCLHHNHETGDVIGFTHRFCNTVEGFLIKLGARKVIRIIENLFPAIVVELTRKK